MTSTLPACGTPLKEPEGPKACCLRCCATPTPTHALHTRDARMKAWSGAIAGPECDGARSNLVDESVTCVAGGAQGVRWSMHACDGTSTVQLRR